jgi:Tfp pilus assembly major pilin PilA
VPHDLQRMQPSSSTRGVWAHASGGILYGLTICVWVVGCSDATDPSYQRYDALQSVTEARSDSLPAAPSESDQAADRLPNENASAATAATSTGDSVASTTSSVNAASIELTSNSDGPTASDDGIPNESTAASDVVADAPLPVHRKPMNTSATAEATVATEADLIATADDNAVVSEIPASALAPVNVVDGTNVSEVLQVRPVMPSPESPGARTAQAPAAAATPRSIELLVPSRDFKSEGKPAALRVSYDDLDLLKVLNMEPVPPDATSHFPSWLKQLDGQRIRIRGFMYPTFDATGIEQFVLARDNQICCFGRDPKVYDLIAVEMKPGTSTHYIPNRPFDVVGIFRIDLMEEDGKALGLYWLAEAQVIEK